MKIITTVNDLRTYLADAFELDSDEAQASAERLQTRDDRPAYGEDWAAWLDALEAEDVHGLRIITTKIPATREDAIALLVELDCARWGEGEREDSRMLHAGLSHGLAMNALANRAELGWGDGVWTPPAGLRAAADAAMTPSDKRFLRKNAAIG